MWHKYELKCLRMKEKEKHLSVIVSSSKFITLWLWLATPRHTDNENEIIFFRFSSNFHYRSSSFWFWSIGSLCFFNVIAVIRNFLLQLWCRRICLCLHCSVISIEKRTWRKVITKSSFNDISTYRIVILISFYVGIS